MLIGFKKQTNKHKIPETPALSFNQKKKKQKHWPSGEVDHDKKQEKDDQNV